MKVTTIRAITSLVVLIALAPAGVLAQGGDAPPKKVSIAFIAYQNPEQLVEDVKPVAAYLERELGVKVEYHIATNYAAIVEALRGETADIGFMGPLQYIIAHQQSGAYPILGELYNGKATYVSRIFVRKDSGIAKLEDLRGKSIAFVDPISSSGYLYPLNTFKEAGLVNDIPEKFFKKMFFAGGDEQAMRAVFNKFVDAAGIGEFSYGLLRPEERDEITYIADSRPMPSHCVVARKGLHRPTAEAIQSALLKVADGPDKDLLNYLYGVSGYAKVTHETYAEVEKIAREYGLTK